MPLTALKYALLIALVLLLASIPLAMQRGTGGIDGLISDERGPIVKVSVQGRITHRDIRLAKSQLGPPPLLSGAA